MAISANKVMAMLDPIVNEKVLTNIEREIDSQLSDREFLLSKREGSEKNGYAYSFTFDEKLSLAEGECLKQRYMEAGFYQVELYDYDPKMKVSIYLPRKHLSISN